MLDTPGTAKPTAASTPASPVPQRETGTEDGFTYVIRRKETQETAALVEYLGDREHPAGVFLPDRVRRSSVPVTDLPDNLCAGCTFREAVELPHSLERIGSRVFQGSRGLHFLFAYSPFQMQRDSFAGCALQSVVLLDGAASIQWTAEGDYRFFRTGTETPYGTVLDYDVPDNRALYAITDQNTAILVDLAEPLTEYTVPQTISFYPDHLTPVRWIDRSALDHLSRKIPIRLPASCLFHASLSAGATWKTEPNTLADMWRLTCKLAQGIQAVQGCTPPIEPSLELIQVAAARAAEYAEVCSWTSLGGNPDGLLVKVRSTPYLQFMEAYAMGCPWEEDGYRRFCKKIAKQITEEARRDPAECRLRKIGIGYCTAKDAKGDISWVTFGCITAG